MWWLLFLNFWLGVGLWGKLCVIIMNVGMVVVILMFFGVRKFFC